MKISKKNWVTTTFGEVAIQQKTDIDRNSDTVDRYIAGEHMNSEDLHIRHWGVFNGQYLGPAFRRKFEKDDILYGSRRTYLKKVAVADFAGITANTTFVIKANEERIWPRLLPFLMLSDSFTEHSVKHSKGSVNPYINWKDIANYEFKLPPSVDDQKRIADLLWSIDKTVVKYEALLNRVLDARSALLKTIYSASKIKKVCISDLPIQEINGMWKTEEKDDVIEAAIIRSTEIQPFGEIAYESAQIHVVKKRQFMDRKLAHGDIVVERSGGGPDQPVGRVCFFDRLYGNYTFSNFTSAIRATDHNVILPKYLLNFLLFFYEIKGTDRLQKQTTGIRNLDYELYRKIKIPLREVSDQKECIKKVENVEENRKKVLSQILVTKNLQKQIINQIFG